MPTGSRVDTLTIDGVAFKSTRAPAATGDYSRAPITPMAAAKAGTLTARTDNDTGTATMAGGHGLTTGRMDVYWTHTDGTKKCRYGMTGTVTVNAVALDGGAGDNLPATSTALRVAAPVLYDFPVAAASLVALGLGCDQPAAFVLRDDGAATVLAAVVTGATNAFAWDSGGGVANPLGDDVADVYVSHGGEQAATPRASVLIN